MKRKFISFLLAISLTITGAVGFSGKSASAIDNSNVNVSQEVSEDQTVDRSSETFDEFLKRVADTEYLSENEMSNKLLSNLKSYYEKNGVELTQEELDLRSKIYCACYIYDDYNLSTLPKILDKLQIKYEDMPYILTGIFLPEEVEFLRTAFYILTFDKSMLTEEDDQLLYNFINDYIKEDSPSDYTEQDIKEQTNLGWALSTLDMSRYTTDELIAILKELEIDIETLAYYRIIHLDRPIEDVVSQVYYIMLLRKPDEEGLKYWSNFLESGSDLNSMVDEMMESIEMGDEYKQLQAKVDVPTEM